jgi:hypothetical protein
MMSYLTHVSNNLTLGALSDRAFTRNFGTLLNAYYTYTWPTSSAFVLKLLIFVVTLHSITSRAFTNEVTCSFHGY